MTDTSNWLAPSDAEIVTHLSRALRDATEAALVNWKFRRTAYENWCPGTVAAIPRGHYDRLDAAAVRVELARQKAFDGVGK